MAPNPVVVTIPANCQGIISAISNASYLQQATVVLGDTTAVFTGSGENVPMKLADRTDSLPFKLFRAPAPAPSLSDTTPLEFRMGGVCSSQ
jgi:hypothetical protein